MNTNNKNRPTPLSIFKKAACTYFKCRQEDIDIRMITESKEAFVVHNENFYQISTREKLREDIEFQLTDKDAVHHIDFGCWIEATKNTVSIKHFLDNLIDTLQDIEQANTLFTTIGIASYAEDVEVAFWNILARIDKDGELMGNAMVSVAQVYNGSGFIDDLTDLQIINGDEVYNRVEGGIFEIVYVEDAQHRTFEFFIYSSEHYFTE